MKNSDVSTYSRYYVHMFESSLFVRSSRAAGLHIFVKINNSSGVSRWWCALYHPMTICDAASASEFRVLAWEYHLCRYLPPRNFTRSSFNVTNRWFSNRARHRFSVMVSPLRNRAMFRVSSELIKPTTLMFSHVGVRHKDQLTMIRWQYRQCTGLCLPDKCISTIFTAGITDSFYCISISIWYYNLNN